MKIKRRKHNRQQWCVKSLIIMRAERTCTTNELAIITDIS